MKYCYEDVNLKLEANVWVASIGMDLQRFDLRQEAFTGDFKNDIDRDLHFGVYADLIAASPSGSLIIEGEAQPWPPTHDQVINVLPKTALNGWLEAVYKLNPDWMAQPPAKTQDEEKKSEPSSESEPSIGSSTS